MHALPEFCLDHWELLERNWETLEGMRLARHSRNDVDGLALPPSSIASGLLESMPHPDCLPLSSVNSATRGPQVSSLIRFSLHSNLTAIATQSLSLSLVLPEV
jgi:hypothetical protein